MFMWAKGGYSLTRFYVFLIRAFLGAIFAVLLTRMFYPQASLPWVILTAVGLVGLAYVTEYFRMRKK